MNIKAIETKKSTRLIATVIIAIIVFMISFVPVYADFGPKPSITITIKNPPDDTYYVALLHKAKPYHWHEEEVDERYEYYVDGYSIFESPVGTNIKESNAEGRYVFSYMVPDTFKVLVVTSDGKEYVSNEITAFAFDSECIYDMSTGVLKENVITVRNVTKVSVRFLICFVLTVAMEAFVMLMFSLTYHKNFNYLLIINVITQILLNVVTILTLKMHLGGGRMNLIGWLATEIAIIIIESVYYCKRLKHKDGEIHSVRNVIYGVVANIFSLLIEVPAFFIVSFITGI